eukprot:gnl/MRDRNA2_/MRDRNA2_85455_c0_seq1.p1 gnl/MRDRNA2_/MRDRNA2_85455_c0~~gnl/MRDRNA2_/MRDRNA2_85455_c0_seq1.p1  ORF type:complete len:340 (+),score=67.36 gnl/MRDRNA2_/MRDRNA2_85455_c0_seq1:156-1022(+)
MVPLADMVNHPPDGVAENARPSYDVATGTFKLLATQDIAPGAGVYWDYGFKSNRNSLLRYGFASEARVPLTDMPLFVRLTDLPGEDSPARKYKLDMIERLRVSGDLMIEADGIIMHELSLALGGRFFEDLIGHMRFSILQTQKTSVIDEYCGSTYCRPIGLHNERQALAHLVSFLVKLADSYETDAAADKKLLDGNTLSGGERDAVIIRLGEKKILRGFGNVVKAIDPLFDLSPWALAKQAEKHWSDMRSDIHGYVRNNITALVNLEGMRWAKRKMLEEKEAKAKNEL